MPKRSNEFQRMIALIEQTLADSGVRVIESRSLREPSSGECREIDVALEGKFSGYDVFIGIECRDWKRKVDVTWIDEIIGKYTGLNVSKIVAVSRSGFSAPALKKAQAYKIETLTLAEAQKLDWAKALDSLCKMKLESFLLPYVESIDIVFHAPTPKNIDRESVPKFEFYTKDGRCHGSLRNVVNAILDQSLLARDNLEKIRSVAFENETTGIKARVPFKDGSYVVNPSGKKHPVFGFDVVAKCHKEVSEFVTTRATYRGEQVLVAGGVSCFGRPVTFASVQREGEMPEIMLYVGPNPARKQRSKKG